MPISTDTIYNSNFNGKPLFFPTMTFCIFFVKMWWNMHIGMHIWSYNMNILHIKHSQNERCDCLKNASWFWTLSYKVFKPKKNLLCWIPPLPLPVLLSQSPWWAPAFPHRQATLGYGDGNWDYNKYTSVVYYIITRSEDLAYEKNEIYVVNNHQN